MYSSLIGKIEKAKRYAQEPHRITLHQFSTTFQGDHAEYQVSFTDGHWRCTCFFFEGHALCSHTMALQHILGEMVPSQSLTPS